MKVESLLENRALELSVQVTEVRLKRSGVTFDHKSLGIRKPVIVHKLCESCLKKLAGLEE